MSVLPDDVGSDEGCAAGPRPDPATTEAGASCSCEAMSLATPAGEIIVLRVAGEVDLLTLAVLQAALADGLARRPCHLVVDIGELIFCDGRGLALLVLAARTAAGHGFGYTVTAASRPVARAMTAVWRGADLPDRSRSAAAGVLAALASQLGRPDGIRPAPPSGHDRGLVEKARSGDVDAYRALVHRHRGRMQRIAMDLLQSLPPDDHRAPADDLIREVAAELRTVVAGFVEPTSR
jgi:anti-anti-sigma factor